MTPDCYLDDSNGAAIAGRALMQALARRGIGAEVLCGMTLDDAAVAPRAWLVDANETLTTNVSAAVGLAQGQALNLRGVAVTLHRGWTSRDGQTDPVAADEFLRLFESIVGRSRPDIVIGYGGDPVMRGVFNRARVRGLATTFTLRDFGYHHQGPFADVDAVIVPSRFAADYYRDALGLECAVMPNLVDLERVRVERPAPEYVTFVNPSREKGVHAFARIADELGRMRPDIPVLVVESRGNESTVASCGLDLRRHGTVHFLANTPDPRLFWGVTRICLMPSLFWESQGLVAVEAMINGIPVVASDRGALPETLGGAGVVLSLPERLTPATRFLPSAEEVAPWVEAIIRLWDDQDHAEEHRRLALARSETWTSGDLELGYLGFLDDLGTRAPRRPHRGDLGGLSDAYPWPLERPRAAPHEEVDGWLGGGTDRLLARELSPGTRLVVELGSWLGLSTRFIADAAPDAVVISVDHWEGSPEHRRRPEFRDLLPNLYDTFLSLCWDYRDRVIPLRMRTLDGLRTVASFGLMPDLIYIDAEHSYEAVTAELDLSRQLFPRAAVVGDDYDWSGVRDAVEGFARRNGLLVERVGPRGWKVLDPPACQPFHKAPPSGRTQAVVLVPYLEVIDWPCEQSLRRLEDAGVRVIRHGGCSQIDVARNVLASESLHDGARSLLFIDADLGFDPQDALRLLASPTQVVAGIYPKKSRREMSSIFADGVDDVLFGAHAPGLYPLRYAATGFLRIRSEVLWRMIEVLQLPLCNTAWDRGLWTFFQPMTVPMVVGFHYLGEDWAFSYRLGQIGVTPMADTSIRLWHYGKHPFGWEDAGADNKRFATYSYRPEGR